jgi:hypothetical protein
MQDILIYDNFYENPDKIREIALETFKEYIDENLPYDYWHFKDYKGNYNDIPGLINNNNTIIGRTFATDSLFDKFHYDLFENLLNSKIQYTCEKNGVFLLDNCLSNPISVNIEENIKNKKSNIEEWIGIVFLTKDPPVEGGITIKNYKNLNINSIKSLENIEKKFRISILNELISNKKNNSAWEIDCKIANVYNRLVLFKKDIFYSSSLNFGINLKDSRITQFFSFGVIYN